MLQELYGLVRKFTYIDRYIILYKIHVFIYYVVSNSLVSYRKIVLNLGSPCAACCRCCLQSVRSANLTTNRHIILESRIPSYIVHHNIKPGAICGLGILHKIMLPVWVMVWLKFFSKPTKTFLYYAFVVLKT